MIVYARSDQTRKPEFQVITTIEGPGPKLKVRKRTVYPEGQKHLRKMIQSYTDLAKINNGFKISPPKLEADSIIFNYHTGQNLAAKFTRLVSGGNLEGACDILDEVLSRMHKLPAKQTDITAGSEFENVFGSSFLGTQMSIEPGCIDYNLDNIIEVGSTWWHIDYEWVFGFPIPLDFITARLVADAFWRTNDYFLLAASEEMQVVSICDRVFIPKLLYERYKKYLDMLPAVISSDSYFQYYVRGGSKPGMEQPVLSVNQMSPNSFPGLSQHNLYLSRETKIFDQKLRELTLEHENAVNQLRHAQQQLDRIYNSSIWKALRLPKRAYRKLFTFRKT